MTVETAAQTQTQDGDYAEEVVREYMDSPEAQDAAAEFGYEDGRGFFLRVPNFEMYMSGFLQMGVAVFENDTPDNNNIYPNGISLKTDVYLYNDWHGVIELNFHQTAQNMFQTPGLNADGTQLWDAYIEYLGMKDAFDNPMLAIRAGQFHVPFTIAGQWNPNGGVGIWSDPYIGWAHGRDPGLMLWGVLSDIVEYKLSVHNGDGATTLNSTDDVMFAGSLRFYPMKKSENADVFVHIGAIRSRDNNVHRLGNVNSAGLTTPWMRTVFDGNLSIDTDGNGFADAGTESTQGWRTGVDFGISAQMGLDNENVNSIYFESEIMWITWERDFASARLPFLEGFGGQVALSFQHNLDPEIGAGIFTLFKFGYADIDNRETNSVTAGANIPGQRVWTYTAGLGYSFNDHVAVEFDWVMVNLDEPDIYNANSAARNDRPDGSDDTEHAWFV
jgi:hypothetical protein